MITISFKIGRILPMNIFSSSFKERVKTEKFILTRSILVISASMLGNVFGYLFQIYSARYFKIEDYSVLISLFNLSGILLVFITFFTGGLTKLVAEIKDVDYPERISKLFLTLIKFHFTFSIVLLILMILCAPLIQSYLKINDLKLIYAFSFAIFAGNLVGFLPPMLQGLLRFKAYSLVSFMAAMTKFLVIVVVMYLQLYVFDVFIGLALTTLTMGLLSFLLLRKNLRIKKYEFDIDDFKKLIKYSLLSAIGMAGISVMQNLDVVLVKHHFDALTAGIYGSTTVIGRIVFFAASPVAIVMLPICAEKFKKSEDYIKPFLISIFISAGIAITISMMYGFAPKFIINVLFGSKYEGAIPYLGFYGFYMVAYTILNLLTVFFISISKFKYAALAIVAPIIEYIGLLTFNKTLNEIITVNVVSCLITIVLLGISFAKVLGENKK